MEKGVVINSFCECVCACVPLTVSGRTGGDTYGAWCGFTMKWLVNRVADLAVTRLIKTRLILQVACLLCST